MHKTKSGFTLVELLIVIVVIAILAAITIVAYNGIQSKANNTKTISVANSLEKAINLWHIQTGNQPLSGGGSTAAMSAAPSGEACPGSTTAGGWVSHGSYSCTLEDLLVAYKMIPDNLTSSLPSNKIYGAANGTRTMMFYTCSATTNGYILMWYLDNASASDTAHFSTEWKNCANNQSADVTTVSYYTTYGMRDGKFISLN